MTLTTTRQKFTEIHWGDEPSGSAQLLLPTGRCGVIGEAVDITYVAAKGARSGVYRHRFDVPPLVVTGDLAGSRKFRNMTGTAVVLGALVSLKLKGTAQRLKASALVVTDARGSGVWFAGLGHGVGLGLLAQRGGTLEVLEGGIEG